MKHAKFLCASIAVLILAGTAAEAENVLRWTSQGDALTLDPHSQNEGPTNALNGMIYESLAPAGANSGRRR